MWVASELPGPGLCVCEAPQQVREETETEAVKGCAQWQTGAAPLPLECRGHHQLCTHAAHHVL